MEDVAARAGVSRALVSLVMRNSPKVSHERRAAVLAAAEELGYRPNAAARSLAERRTNTIGVVINDLHNTFFADVADGVHELASAFGMRLLLNAVWAGDDDEKDAIEGFLEHRTDAVILLGPTISDEALRGIAGDVPLVAVGRRPAAERCDSVTNDDAHGAALAVDHLVSLGHSDIVHVDGGRGAGADDRRRGFTDRMSDLGLEPRVVGGEFDEVSGQRAADHLVEAEAVPTAIFCANDLVATGVLDRLQEHGLRIPDHVSVVGYDNTALAALHHVSLTTVHQPRRQMGERAMELVLSRLRDGRAQPRHDLVEPSLVERSTTGPAPAGRTEG